MSLQCNIHRVQGLLCIDKDSGLSKLDFLPVMTVRKIASLIICCDVSRALLIFPFQHFNPPLLMQKEISDSDDNDDNLTPYSSYK